MNKILLAGIAKDEGAYLPEWIFYHLKLGIGKILIYVNNTTDNSLQILEKISKNYPVDYKVVDGIESFTKYDSILEPAFKNRNPLQSRAYADIYSNVDKSLFSHILFLDIDEFIYGSNGNSLRNITNSDAFLFNWYNLAGDITEFSLIESAVRYVEDRYTKFIVRTGLDDIVFQSTHSIKINGKLPCNNNNFKVLHRHLRSKAEYLSLLGRRDTFNNCINGFKKNRKGWSSKAKEKISLSLENYHDKFLSFIYENDIEKDLLNARNFVMERHSSVMKQIEDVRQLNKELEQILWGTGISHHEFNLRNLIKKKIQILYSSRKIHNHH